MPQFSSKLTKKHKGVGGRPKSIENIHLSECFEATLGKQDTPPISPRKLSSPDYKKYILYND